MLPFAEAVERLHLPAHFCEHTFVRYDEANLKVRYYEKSGVIEGDIDLDALCYRDNVAGIFAKQDLTVTGTIFNWEIDTTAAFLAPRQCRPRPQMQEPRCRLRGHSRARRPHSRRRDRSHLQSRLYGDIGRCHSQVSHHRRSHDHRGPQRKGGRVERGRERHRGASR